MGLAAEEKSRFGPQGQIWGPQKKDLLSFTSGLERELSLCVEVEEEWPNRKDRLQRIAGQRGNKIMEGLGGSFECSRPTLILCTVRLLCLKLSPNRQHLYPQGAQWLSVLVYLNEFSICPSFSKENQVGDSCSHTKDSRMQCHHRTKLSVVNSDRVTKSKCEISGLAEKDPFLHIITLEVIFQWSSLRTWMDLVHLTVVGPGGVETWGLFIHLGRRPIRVHRM